MGWIWWTDCLIYHIFAISLTSLALFHSIKCYRSPNSKNWKSNGIALLSLFVIISFALNTIAGSLQSYTYFAAWCNFTVIFNSICYENAKMCLYLLFVLVRYKTYNSTIFKYNKYLYLLAVIFILLQALSFILLDIFGLNGKAISDGIYSRCVIDDKSGLLMLIFLLVLVSRIFYPIVAAFSFIRPLYALAKTLNTKHKANNAPRSLSKMANRYIVLSLAVSLSTVILIILAMTGFTFFGLVDFIVNTVVAMLMTELYDDKMYHVLCCPVIKCTKYCCCCCSAKYEQKQQCDQHEKDATNTSNGSIYETRDISSEIKQKQYIDQSEITQTNVQI